MSSYHTISLLAGVMLTRATRKQLAPHMLNWLTISAYLRKIEADHSTEFCVGVFKAMLAMELERGTPRWHVIERLHQRVNAQRKHMEVAQLRTWLQRYRRAP
jgi:hypothetical protein